jgi:hypothetical protein
VWLLLLLSVWNAFFTFTRVRHYRLFELNIEKEPETPSMRRVRVQSSPPSSSPLRFISDLMAEDTAESRAHPDKTRDVWELSVWDPLPICIGAFSVFSPCHALVYWMFLPLQDQHLDPYPSLTVVKCILLQMVVTVQLHYLQARFSQQMKDTAIIQKEVLHEYDTKYVHPHLHPVVRDAGTQVDSAAMADGITEATLYAEHGPPTTLIKREFQTHPNPNYSKHIDPDGSYPNAMSPRVFTPAPARSTPDIFPPSRFRASAQRHSLPAQSPPVPAHAKRMAASGAGLGAPTHFGGTMGVFTHGNSPLKKATSLGDMNSEFTSSPRNGREMAALEQQREGTLAKHGEKRRQTMANATGFDGKMTPPFGNARGRHSDERYPSRFS